MKTDLIAVNTLPVSSSPDCIAACNRARSSSGKFFNAFSTSLSVRVLEFVAKISFSAKTKFAF